MLWTFIWNDVGHSQCVENSWVGTVECSNETTALVESLRLRGSFSVCYVILFTCGSFLLARSAILFHLLLRFSSCKCPDRQSGCDPHAVPTERCCDLHFLLSQIVVAQYEGKQAILRQTKLLYVFGFARQ